MKNKSSILLRLLCNIHFQNNRIISSKGGSGYAYIIICYSYDCGNW